MLDYLRRHYAADDTGPSAARASSHYIHVFGVHEKKAGARSRAQHGSSFQDRARGRPVRPALVLAGIKHAGGIGRSAVKAGPSQQCVP